MNNCFVFRVDGVLCVGQSSLLSATVLGQVGGAPAQGWGGSHLRVARRGPRRHHSRPALRMRTSRGAEPFSHSPTPARMLPRAEPVALTH